MTRFHTAAQLSLICALLPMLAPGVADARDMPYVVRGNQHILIGITLDEAAVRAALPAGLESDKAMTGGLNVYRSDGGEGVPAYTRSYVWVDLEGYDSLSGTKGRYILWITHEPGSIEKLERLGYDAVAGQTVLAQDGNRVTGVTVVDGDEVMKVAIELGEDECNPAVGTLNYPSAPGGADPLVVTQYAYSADICGATPISVEITAADDSALAKFKPVTLNWAVLAQGLSFAASPPLPQKLAGSE